jgi:Xaa-Pro aminopeptidase
MYRAGKYGIRIENLVNVIEAGKTEFGNFLTFEVLTLCPIDKKAIKKELLTDVEIKWFNDYHQRVFDSVKDDLTPELRDWLAEKTAAI